MAKEPNSNRVLEDLVPFSRVDCGKLRYSSYSASATHDVLAFTWLAAS